MNKSGDVINEESIERTYTDATATTNEYYNR